MPIPVHVICGKCGSLDVTFQTAVRIGEGCGVYVVCNNCSELTSVETINEWKKEAKNA